MKRASFRQCHNAVEASLAVKRSFDRLLVSSINAPCGVCLWIRRRRFCASTCRPTARGPCPAHLPSCAGCVPCRLRLAVPGFCRRQWFERSATFAGPVASDSRRGACTADRVLKTAFSFLSIHCGGFLGCVAFGGRFLWVCVDSGACAVSQAFSVGEAPGGKGPRESGSVDAVTIAQNPATIRAPIPGACARP